MMAEKVEMKRTLLQHGLCRIQVFHMSGSKRPDNSRPYLDVQKNATQLIFVCTCTFALRVDLLPRYLLTHRRILLPRPIGIIPPRLPLLASEDKQGCLTNRITQIPLHSATRSACEINQNSLPLYTQVLHPYSVRRGRPGAEFPLISPKICRLFSITVISFKNIPKYQ